MQAPGLVWECFGVLEASFRIKINVCSFAKFINRLRHAADPIFNKIVIFDTFISILGPGTYFIMILDPVASFSKSFSPF